MLDLYFCLACLYLTDISCDWNVFCTYSVISLLSILQYLYNIGLKRELFNQHDQVCTLPMKRLGFI